MKRAADDKAARAEAEAVIQRWNEQLALGREMLWSPMAALLASTPWSRAIDLRTVDRHPLASPLNQLLAIMLVFIVLTLGRAIAPRCAVA